jgi:hypothetical protein
MTRTAVIIALSILNIALIAALASSLNSGGEKRAAGTAASKETQATVGNTGDEARLHAVPTVRNSPKPAPRSPFEAVYSSDPKQLANNLRKVGCPEETVKDLLVAEINRRFKSDEEALRPKPEDHVPWGWSSRTSEGKLIDRRERAAAITRDKEEALRHSLGYEVPVKAPAYAMSVSDLRFENYLESIDPEKRATARLIHDYYWWQVEDLRSRAQGFWLPEDIAELQELKDARRAGLEQLAKP